MDSSNFEIVADHTKRTRKFSTTGRTVVFKLKDIPVDNPIRRLKDAVEAIVLYATSDVDPDSMMGMTFTSDNFKEKGPAWLSFREASKVTFDDVWEILDKIFQSNSAGLSSDTFRIAVTSVSFPRGTGGNRVKPGGYVTFAEECQKRRGIITIKNKDNLCLPRALIVAIAHVEKQDNYEQLRQTKKAQDSVTKNLLDDSNIMIPEDGAGIPELLKFQEHLKDYKIVVYDYVTKGVIYEGPPARKTLNLLYYKGHFNVITSLTSAFACVYYCYECHVPYNTKNAHRCAASCPCCQQSPPCSKVIEEKLCATCNRSFRGDKCFENHKTICPTVRRCNECLRCYKANDKRQHKCNEVYCKVCKIYTEAGHHCYMQPDTGKPPQDVCFVFYDLETRQEIPLNDNTMVHDPNLCVYMKCCDNCITENKDFCPKCGYRQIILKEQPIAVFMCHLLELRKKFKKVICLAHNAQGFDAQFLLKYIIENTDLQPELIMRGTKILLMAISNLSFIDSLNYFPMALAKLPKAFDLGTELKKGYFPHLFNTKANELYVGPLPAPEYYASDTMRADDRKIFSEWYEEYKDNTFDLQRDLVEYCISDVDILKKACVKFRDMFLKECGVCPFTEAVTIASACNKTFRRKFLKPNTIGLIPRSGYRFRDTQSEIALKWLLWQEKERDMHILHSANGREAVVNGVRVDGYCEDTKQIFEFHGCYYHGHPMCLPSNRDNPLQEDPSDTLNTRYQRTLRKTERLRQIGYEVVEQWECDFRRSLQTNKELCDYVNVHPVLSHTPLNPRDALYGGRTGNTKLYYKAQDGEKIKYADFCSLYPYICIKGKFPIDHPKIYVGEECNALNLNKIDGLIKCTILPPSNLYHPVLPVKMHDKLMFLLCHTCGKEQQQDDCNHDERERTLTGTWVMDEVLKAIETGYQMVQVHEIWKYNVVQYDSLTKEEGLFSPFMKLFIKLKQEASGWPSWCKNESDCQKYIDEFLNREDVQLEYDHIVKNPGLRSLAKLILNSFWGKFGQRENQSKTSIIRQPAELYTMLTNPCTTVNYIQEINDDAMVVNWEFKEESVDPLSTVNVAIAAYVTAQARLKLYGELERLGERVLYYDTDSVIYVSREGQFEPQLGSMIGQLTDELECYGSGSYITEFVSGGPKNYAFRVLTANKEHFTCKVKGITLNYDTSQKINFDSMRNMVLEESPPVYVTSRNIRRTQDFNVVTKTESKVYRINFAKRKREGDYDSLPFGYKRIRPE